MLMETVTFFVRALRLKTTKVRKVGKTEFRKYVSNLIFNLLKKQKKERAERSFLCDRHDRLSRFQVYTWKWLLLMGCESPEHLGRKEVLDEGKGVRRNIGGSGIKD